MMPMFAVDTGSLEALHDIVVPPSVSIWPATTGWYWMIGLSAVIVGASSIWAVARWQHNAYRRAALDELERLEAQAGVSGDTIRLIAELIKRVAMMSCSRAQIASLSGAEWLTFLDTTIGTSDFTQGPGRQLLDVYTPTPQPVAAPLIDLMRHWIIHHQAPSTC